MSRKTADLSKVIVRKGEASPALPTTPAAKDEGRAGSTDAGKVDGRSLRRAGREQWNIRVHPDAKAVALRHAEREGCSLGEIVERALTLYDERDR